MSERNTTHDANESSTNDVGSQPTATRRSVLKAAAVGAAGLTVGSAAIGSGSASGIPLPPLTRCGNKLLDPTGQEVTLRGVNIADPGRQTRKWRGGDRNAEDTLQLALDESASPPSGTWAADQGVDGWHNNIVRIPTQPQDILAGADQGQDWEPWTTMPHGDDWGPALPGNHGAGEPMTEDHLETYFDAHVQPLVDMCEQQGAYAMIDYHRHMPIFHQVQLPWEDLIGNTGTLYRCSDAVSSSKDWENDMGGCGERGVLWHGADQTEEVVNQAGPVYDEYDDLDADPWTDPVAEALGEELETYWSYVANRYAEDDHVIFDIYNEPTGPYNGDWGEPGRMPASGDEDGDGNPIEHPFWWNLWVDRAQPWVDIVEENAPGSVATIGSPRWSQYTYHAGVTSEFDFDELQMCYTGHIYMQDFDIGAQYGPPSQEVPLFFSEFGWAEDGGMDEFEFLAGTASGSAGEEGAVERFESFIEEYPVHPLAWCFDTTWEPFFFTHDDLNEGESNGPWMDSIEPYERRPGQWWMEYASRYEGEDEPSAGSGRPDSCGGTDTDPVALPGNDNAPQDPDGDGLYEDVNGNGEQDLADAVDLYQNRESSAVQDHGSAYDFSGNDEVDLADVVQLYQENTA